MAEWLIALLVGSIQGVAEFIPVSSSAHLTVLGQVFDLPTAFEFYVLINIGTLAALVNFNRDLLLTIIRQCFRGSFGLAGRLFVSTLPAGLAGFFLADLFRFLGGNLYLVAAMLILGGLLMLPRPPRSERPLEDMGSLPWPRVLAIAGAQALALLSGVSRSGATLLAGFWLGLKREMAISWSFLLAIPLTAGAIFRVGLSPEGFELLSRQLALVVLANAVSFIVGLMAISFLLRVIGRYGLRPFGVYRLALGLALLGLLLADVL